MLISTHNSIVSHLYDDKSICLSCLMNVYLLIIKRKIFLDQYITTLCASFKKSTKEKEEWMLGSILNIFHHSLDGGSSYHSIFYFFILFYFYYLFKVTKRLK